MFDADQLDIRKTFYEIWEKYQQKKPLEPLEQQIFQVMIDHPEHHTCLDNPGKYLEKEFPVDAGECNPFLHFGLHLAVQDQIQLDKPKGIKKIFNRLCKRFSPHDAMHEIMREFAYQLSDMQQYSKPFNRAAYMRELMKL